MDKIIEKKTGWRVAFTGAKDFDTAIKEYGADDVI